MLLFQYGVLGGACRCENWCQVRRNTTRLSTSAFPWGTADGYRFAYRPKHGDSLHMYCFLSNIASTDQELVLKVPISPSVTKCRAMRTYW